MNKKELDKFKKILDEKKAKILAHLEDLSQDSEKEMDNTLTGDSADMASVEMNQASMQKIGKRETYLLKKINYAIKKIDDKTYGECESCGEMIGNARLLARPEAQLCIDCKTEQESVERRYSNAEPDEDDSGELAEGEEV